MFDKKELAKEWIAMGKRMDWHNDAFKTRVIDAYFDCDLNTGQLVKALSMPKRVIKGIIHMDPYGKSYYSKRKKDYEILKRKSQAPVSTPVIVVTTESKEDETPTPEAVVDKKSDDFRIMVLKDLEETGNVKATAKKFGVSDASVYYWRKHIKKNENGVYQAKKKSSYAEFTEDKDFIKELIDAYVEAKTHSVTLCAFCNEYGVTYERMQYILYKSEFGRNYYTSKNPRLQEKQPRKKVVQNTENEVKAEEKITVETEKAKTIDSNDEVLLLLEKTKDPDSVAKELGVTRKEIADIAIKTLNKSVLESYNIDIPDSWIDKFVQRFDGQDKKCSEVLKKYEEKDLTIRRIEETTGIKNLYEIILAAKIWNKAYERGFNAGKKDSSEKIKQALGNIL